MIWVKHGWADYYQGDAVDGNYAWLADGGEGHEAFNFLPDRNGWYYGYVPPQGRYAGSPYDKDDDRWTVVFLAKHGNRKGVHIVGWYENARLVGKKVDARHLSVRSMPMEQVFVATLAEKNLVIRSLPKRHF